MFKEKEIDKVFKSDAEDSSYEKLKNGFKIYVKELNRIIEIEYEKEYKGSKSDDFYDCIEIYDSNEYLGSWHKDYLMNEKEIHDKDFNNKMEEFLK
jgi:hypothetical protein